MHTVAVLVGSLRKASINKRLSLAFADIGKDLFTFVPIPLEEIPFFNQDLEGNPPPSVVALRKTITEADGILFITPEYNRSLPAVMKNAVDWASRPYGKHSLTNKPAAVAGMSPGQTGAGFAQTELRRILLMLTVRVLGQPEMFIGNGMELIDAAGNVGNEDSAKFFRMFLEKYHNWIDIMKV